MPSKMWFYALTGFAAKNHEVYKEAGNIVDASTHEIRYVAAGMEMRAPVSTVKMSPRHNALAPLSRTTLDRLSHALAADLIALRDHLSLASAALSTGIRLSKLLEVLNIMLLLHT
jgi:hypothetical protein